ncbi:MAG: hypothetical protein JSU74_13520 [Candidatus Zixiibacteriota bacterium]|nr:MAG: hypothetical protein JSU74_13520 [candidate division Zixibacteria bacterium]
MKLLTVTVVALTLLSPASNETLANSRPEPIYRDHFAYYSDNASYVDRVERVIGRTRERLLNLLRDSLDYRPSVYIVSDQSRFNDLIGGKFPDWGAAAAFPERRLVAVKSPAEFNLNRSLDELLAHEYAHLVLARNTGLFSAPRWFDEGLAMLVSMEWSWSDNLAMSKAAVFGQLVDLSDIEKVNRFSEGKAHVAYAEAYLAVTFLIDTYDREAIGRFVETVARGGSAEEAIWAATGATGQEFEQDFRLHLNRRFNIISLFMDTIFFWLGLSVLVVIGGWLRFRKRRRYYRQWQEDEKLESTDFEYGDPEQPEHIDDDDEPWRA